MPIYVFEDFGRTVEVKFFVDCNSVLVCVVEELLCVFVIEGSFESNVVVWALLDLAISGESVI